MLSRMAPSWDVEFILGETNEPKRVGARPDLPLP
jgi:hypothetical protein